MPKKYIKKDARNVKNADQYTDMACAKSVMKIVYMRSG